MYIGFQPVVGWKAQIGLADSVWERQKLQEMGDRCVSM